MYLLNLYTEAVKTFKNCSLMGLENYEIKQIIQYVLLQSPLKLKTKIYKINNENNLKNCTYLI